jgi:hypothetical protein
MTGKNKLVMEYLKQQCSLIDKNTCISDKLLEQGQIHLHTNQIVPFQDQSVDDESVLDFKNKVRMWITIDNEMKDINSKIKLLDNERKQRKKMIDLLSLKILEFMGANEIDELNSREGVIKYKKSFIKETMTQKQIIQKLKDEFKNIEDAGDKISKVFKDRQRVEIIKLLRY